MLKPLPDQQDLPANISSLSTEVNSRNEQRAKEVNDSKPKLKQDRERSSKPVAELVEESDGLESCPIKSKKLLDLITCYSNVKVGRLICFVLSFYTICVYISNFTSVIVYLTSVRVTGLLA